MGISIAETQLREEGKLQFGICFDVDGVLMRGTIPIPAAIKAMKKLHDDAGKMKVPVLYLTNSLNRNQDKAMQLSKRLEVKVDPSQMIQAQGPLEMFKEYHNMFCLVVGQGKVGEIAKDLGFTNFCSLDEISEAYPLLDMVDHDNRKRIAAHGYTEKDMPAVEAIILLGEPKRWESYLQVLVDLLKTNGKPIAVPTTVPKTHIPVIACNMDLQFMDRACMARYGHGAFLLCLEALYQKVTGSPLRYTSLVGKPSEVTMRYANHCMTRAAIQMGTTDPIPRMYVIGDTPESDIVGANLYQKYVTRQRKQTITTIDVNKNVEETFDSHLPASRNLPSGVTLHEQMVSECHSVLVCTGCYRKGTLPEGEGEKNYKGHRDFEYSQDVYQPGHITDDVNDAVSYILMREGLEC